MARTLDELYDYLDRLDGRPDLDELKAELEELGDGEFGQLEPHVRFSPKTYARNLVRAGAHYHLLVLCWRNGQCSPIHDHAGSACGLRVLRGVMTETRFEFTPEGNVFPVFSRDAPPGTVAATEDSDMHRVSNLQANGADLVTLHVYAPPLLRMHTFSLFDRSRGEELMFAEYCEAGGI
jgi:cysteine dioxygenase